MIFWKIYFYFIVVKVIQSFLKEEFNTFYDYFSWGTLILGVFGLFLYVFKEKCFNIWLWRVYFVYFLIENFHPSMPRNMQSTYFEKFIVFILLIPYIIALFSYAFLDSKIEDEKSKGLWG